MLLEQWQPVEQWLMACGSGDSDISGVKSYSADEDYLRVGHLAGGPAVGGREAYLLAQASQVSW